MLPRDPGFLEDDIVECSAAHHGHPPGERDEGTLIGGSAYH